MTKRRYRRARSYISRRFRRSKAFTLPLAPVLGVVAMPGISNAITQAAAGDFPAAFKYLKSTIGMADDGVFHVEWLIQNMIPPVVGLLVHKVVGGWLGLNRMLASAGVPIIRI